MKSIFIPAVVLILVSTFSLSAQAHINRLINEFNCRGANGVQIELKKPGVEAVVKTRLGYMTLDYTARIAEHSGQRQLTLRNGDEFFFMPVTVNLTLKTKQILEGVLWKRVSQVLSRPSTQLQCEISLR